jgi:hypothetical protein
MHVPSTILLLMLSCGEESNEAEEKQIEQAADVDEDGVDEESDCDDSDPAVYPDAEEVCDGIDNDCDEEIDEDVSTVYYLDEDADGYGTPDAQTEDCEQPEGYTDNGDDCDDSAADLNPGEEEVCDLLDNDCDGAVDEEVEPETHYADSDGDTYGDPLSSLESCEIPDGYVGNADDCDDSLEEVNPAAEEDRCDGIDNDCNGETDLPGTGWMHFEPMALGDVPEDWEMAWDDAGQTTSAEIAEYLGERFFEIRSSEAPYHRVAAKYLDVEAEDMEVLFLTSSNSQYFNFALRAQGDSHDGHNAYLVSGWPSQLKIIKEVDSSDSYGGWSTIGDAAVSATGATWIRFRVQGSELKARRWEEQAVEPTDWDLEISDEEIAGAGWMGMVTQTNYANRVRVLGWAIDGQTADACIE